MILNAPSTTALCEEADEAALLQNPLKLWRRQQKRSAVAWITDDLAVSALPDDSQLKELAAAGIAAVVDLREDREWTSSYVTSAFRYVRLPIVEQQAPSIEDLDWIAGWIVSTINNGCAVLVHCKEGRGRSPMIACAALMKLGFSPHQALALVSRAIPEIELSRQQRHALEEYAKRPRGKSVRNGV